MNRQGYTPGTQTNVALCQRWVRENTRLGERSPGFSAQHQARRAWVRDNVRCFTASQEPEDDFVIELTPLGLSILEGDPEPAASHKISRRAAIPVTPAQRRILMAIKQYMDSHDGIAPTQVELAAILGLNALTVREHILNLAARGALRRMPGRARGIELASGALGDPDPWAALKALIILRQVTRPELWAAFKRPDSAAREEILAILREDRATPAGAQQGQASQGAPSAGR